MLLEPKLCNRNIISTSNTNMARLPGRFLIPLNFLYQMSQLNMLWEDEPEPLRTWNEGNGKREEVQDSTHEEDHSSFLT